MQQRRIAENVVSQDAELVGIMEQKVLNVAFYINLEK